MTFKNAFRDAFIFCAGIGFYVLAQAFVDWQTRRGETLAAQACVTQLENGRWLTVQCAGAIK